MNQNTLPYLVETGALLERLDDPNLLIVDLCRPAQYRQAHIPGAVFLPFQSLMSGDMPAAGKLPPLQHLTRVLESIGLTPDRPVVAYDDEGGGWAGRLLWTLDMVGHHNWAYLNGGLHAWAGDGLALENTPVQTEPSALTLELESDPSVTLETLLTHLDDPDWVIWDARSVEEYLGLQQGAMKLGHIPGAVNYEWTRAMDRQNHLRLRPLKLIRQELADLGITGDRQIVTHCQSHHRSAFTYILGRILGFERVSAYPGSWSEWGNDPRTPVSDRGN